MNVGPGVACMPNVLVLIAPLQSKFGEETRRLKDARWFGLLNPFSKPNLYLKPSTSTYFVRRLFSPHLLVSSLPMP